MKTRQIRLLCCASTLLMLASCGARPRITGLIVDIREKPLADATVQVAGTTLSTQTDSDGKYSLPYVPGQFTVSYSKPGFSTFSRNQNIAVEAEVPAETVMLIELPRSKGIFYVASNKYVQLAGVDIQSEEKRLPFSWIGTTAERIYTPVSPGKWAQLLVPSVPPEQKMLFLDNNGFNDTLVFIQPDDSIWKRSFRGVGMEYTDEAQGVNVSAEEVQDGLFLWKIQALPGRYSFVVRNADDAFTAPISSPAYPFRVQIDLPPAEAAGILGTWKGTIGNDTQSGPIEVHLDLDRDGSTASSVSFLGGTSAFGTTKYALWNTQITPDSAAFTIPFGWHHDGTLVVCTLQMKEGELQGPCDQRGPKEDRWQINLRHGAPNSTAPADRKAPLSGR